MTNAVSLAQQASTGVSQGFKNRIINGAMVIDQRNAGASVTQGTSATYVTDRFYIRGTVASKFTGQQSTTAPTGFKNSLVCTSSSAYTVGASEAFFAGQVIEGFNIADLGWGSSSAATITLSFWTRSSLTGTFGGSLCNYTGDRSYPFTYTISSANTWEYKTITIAGDTTGTWSTDNGGGIVLNIGLGAGSSLSGTAGSWAAALYRSATGATSVVGTNGATFYITGVQLEVGSTATSFDYRPYGTELVLCQRYYEKSYPVDTVPGTSSVSGASWWFVSSSTSGYIYGTVFYRVTKRTAATITFYSYTGTAGQASDGNVANIGAVGIRGQNNVQQFCAGNDTGGTVTPAGGNVNVHWTSDAEL